MSSYFFVRCFQSFFDSYDAIITFVYNNNKNNDVKDVSRFRA